MIFLLAWLKNILSFLIEVISLDLININIIAGVGCLFIRTMALLFNSTNR